MGDFQNFRFEDAIPDLCPETQLNFRKFLQAAGIENMLIKDGRRISDTEVLNEIRKEVAMLSINDDDDEHTTSLIPACMNGDVDAVKLLLMSGECDINEVAPDGETALTCAVSTNDVRIVEVLLKHGADPNFRGKKVECSPLMEAAGVGYTDIVKLLLGHGACVGHKSHTGNTALHYAATSGHLQCVCLLLQYNSPMETQNETGHTPLMEATSNGHIDVARCLIKQGCDINAHSTEFKESALTLASYKGHVEMVKFLLEAGADHEHRTDEMHTALMEAAMEGHVEVARLLLAHGANVNIPQDSFESPLTLAACGGHTELTHLLIGYGADIEEVNDEGYTPLMEAAREGHEETVALLLAVGADVNARTEETQETALTLAACGGFIEVCEMLLNAGADIEVGGIGCSTPLMEAAQEGHLELVRRLLQRGAAVNAVTATGDTALHYAAENGHVKVCKELLDWGTMVGAMTEGARTPLMKAARTGHLEVVQLFLEHGVAIDQPTSQNDANALSLACSGGHAKMVEFLLQHGADPQYQLRDGSTMLIEAARSGNPAVLRLILDYPKCLSKPAVVHNQSVPRVSNYNNAQQIQHPVSPSDQHSSYTHVNTVCTVGNSVMPPPPHLPVPVTGVSGVDMCLDHVHSHIHPQAHSHSCRSHKQLAFHSPTLPASTSSAQPQALNAAALANAYAVGWAAGAAALVQQQQQQQHTLNPRLHNSDLPATVCPSTNTTPLASQSSSTTTHDQQLDACDVFETASGTYSHTASVTPQNSQLKLQTTTVATAVHTATGLTSVHTVLTQATLGTSGTEPSTVIPNEGSFNINESNTSSVLTGTSIDLTDDIGAGLLALFQELRPDPKTDKDELMRRFEAVMCPFNALRVARTVVGHQCQQQMNSTAETTAMAMSTNATRIALSKLDQQSPCHVPPACSKNKSNEKDHVMQSDGCLSKTTHWSGLLTNAYENQLLETMPVLPNGVQIPRNSCTADHSELNKLDNSILEISTDAAPFVSSCHLSCSALSASECSVSSICSTNLHCRTAKITPSFDATLSGLGSYEYGLDKANEVFGSTMDSPYLNNLVDNVGLPATQGILHETRLNRDMLACYRHYHHPGSHFSCTLDAAAAVASLGHTNTHPNNHHSLTVSSGSDAIVTPNGLLHVPHPNNGLPMDTLINPMGNVAYDSSSVGTAHQHTTHPVSLSLSGNRILPMGTQNVLPVEGIPPSNHVLTSNDLPPTTNNCISGTSTTPVIMPSLVDVNACIESSMETALTLACSGGFADLVRLLLERGADKEHRDKKSHTPLHTAVYANQRTVVALLLDYGAEIEAQVDRTKDTALSIACSYGRLEIVEELLSRGANKEHRNISDYTPLSLAASGGYVDVIQLLLRHGAEINSRTGSKLGISPLMLASMNGHTAAVRLLLEHGSDINAHIETNRNTALTLACFQGRSEVVQLLVERKANIEHRAKTGLTPLMEAASGDYVEVGRILLDHGADVNALPVPSSRDTALTIAADKGNAKFVNLLLEKGAIVESHNKKGATPLWLASNGGHLEVVQSLIQYNADVNSQDNRKVSCLMAAFRKGHINVARLLVQYVTQFPSDKDCIRHIKTAVTEKELAKRCQQCREIIIAAKEKQEGEARKNADCLLEQIEQEEEERANREAMQARKRERKRMKRKAKQEKERQVKSVNHVSCEFTSNENDTTSGINSKDDNIDQDNLNMRSNDHSPTLSYVLKHAQNSSICDQSVNACAQNFSNEHSSQDFSQPKVNSLQSTPVTTTITISNGLANFTDSNATTDSHTTNQETYPTDSTVKYKTAQQTKVVKSTSGSSTVTNGLVLTSKAASAITEAKREKHRNKKQNQRAAKRAAAENGVSDSEKRNKSPHSDISDSHSTLLSLSPSYYAISSSGDNDVNWNALIESQNNQFNQYLAMRKHSTTTNESNNWTIVPPSNNTRSTRSTNVASSSTSGRTGYETTTDWKTTNSGGSSYKRRISIPVSRHDIGKVIGQGGAVVSALRNMSGIQIDIESARSDEVTERMVYLKGPNEAVQRTYETIQGLLNGSIAGNDVLLTYASLKKSTTQSSVPLGNTILSAVNFRSNGTATVTASSANKVVSSITKPIVTSKATRRNGKSAAVNYSPNAVRPTNAQPTTSHGLNKAPTKPSINSVVSSNNNNNSTTVSGIDVNPLPSTICSKPSNSGLTPNWSSKLALNGSNSKGNFASVAAAGLVTQQNSRVTSKNLDNQHLKSERIQVKSTTPSMFSVSQSTLSTNTPNSLLSLNLSAYQTSNQGFNDYIQCVPTMGEFTPDALDEMSFPPLNPTKSASLTNAAVANTVTSLSDSISATHTTLSPSEQIHFDSESQNFSGVAATSNNIFSTLRVFDTITSTGQSSNSFPQSTISGLSPSHFGPLTVSPPIGNVPSSQPHTPVGSGSCHSGTFVSTPTTTTTQTKSFARAPGSERSAHQRNANTTVASIPLSLGDPFPSSLLSLDVNETVAVNSSVSDALFLTPTKRAISPELGDAHLRQDALQSYRCERSSDWQTCNTSTSTINPSVFPKKSAFSLTVNSAVTLSTSDEISNVKQFGDRSLSGISSSQVQHNMDPLYTVTPWPIQSVDSKSNGLAFQTINNTLNHTTHPTTEVTSTILPSPLVRTDFTSLTTSEQYSLHPTQNALLRQAPSQTHIKTVVSLVGAAPTIQPTHRQTQSGNTSNLTSSNATIANNIINPVSTQNVLNSPVRPKSLVAVTSNMLLEPRATTLMNGFVSTVCKQSSSNLPLNVQFSSMFPSAQHQTALPVQPQYPVGVNALPHLNQPRQQTQSNVISSRLGNSALPLINQPPFNLSGCPPVTGANYNSPTYIPGFVQPPMQTPVGSPSSLHPGSSFATHLVNGVGPSPIPHLTPVCSAAGITTLGVSASVTQSPGQTPVPLQPIGAERRRQGVNYTSSATSNIVYSPLTSSSNLNNNLGPNTTVMGNPLAGIHPQTPPQQCNVNSNANNLFMALTMNWMQQQQHQHASMVGGSTGPSNPPTNWSPNLWPSNSAIGGALANNCPSVKISSGAPSELPNYNNSTILPNPLPTVNGTTGQQQQQQQQSMMAAAMAAMASMYPWNTGTGGNSGLLSGVPAQGIPSTTQNRWICPPQINNSNLSVTQNLFQDQLHTVMKPSGVGGSANAGAAATTSGIHSGSAHHSQAL